jgi:hypothetical protein
MSLPTNALATYSSIGNREDLEDVIYNVAPSETPLLSALETTKAKAVNHEWQTDTIDAADTSNFVLEGDDATTDAITPTVRLGNICQIMDKVVRTTGTEEAIDRAGRGSEMDYQTALKMKALKIDMESIAFGTNVAKVTGAAATPRKMATILTWIGTNDVFGTAGGAASPTTLDGLSTRTDGTQRAFTEALLKSSLQLIWTSGGRPDKIALGGFNKQQMSTFTGRATPQESAEKKKIVNSVDVYEGDFGTQKVVASRNMRSRDCLILQMDMWARANLRGVHTVELAKTGDSERKQMIVEWTLVSRNEKASGGVFDLTTS